MLTLSRRVKTIILECTGPLDLVPTSELLIRSLKSRLQVMDSPLEKSVVNFAVLGRIDNLVQEFVYDPYITYTD